jgi:hypothetical protein
MRMSLITALPWLARFLHGQEIYFSGKNHFLAQNFVKYYQKLMIKKVDRFAEFAIIIPSTTEIHKMTDLNKEDLRRIQTLLTLEISDLLIEGESDIAEIYQELRDKIVTLKEAA